MTDCDVIIVGSGPGGATVAEVLTAAGWSVIILEKGRNHLLDLNAPHEPLSHFANDEQAAALNALVAAGMVDPCLRRTFGFDEVGQAHQLMSETPHPFGNMAILVAAWDPDQAEL